MKSLSLPKGDQVFIFTYEPGDEQAVLDAAIEMVRRREIDWFDAAMVSQKIGQHLAQELKAYLPKAGKQ